MFSIIKSIKSFKFAIKGLFLFFKNENNAKVHLVASFLVVVLGFYFNISKGEWLWISLAIGLVWSAEAFNTAIEKIVDFISPDYNSKAGEIKDLAAGAVLMIAVLSVIIGVLIFKDYIVNFLAA